MTLSVDGVNHLPRPGFLVWIGEPTFGGISGDSVVTTSSLAADTIIGLTHNAMGRCCLYDGLAYLALVVVIAAPRAHGRH